MSFKKQFNSSNESFSFEWIKTYKEGNWRFWLILLSDGPTRKNTKKVKQISLCFLKAWYCFGFCDRHCKNIPQSVNSFVCFLFSLHIRSMWETICDPTASLLGSLSLSDLVFCAFTDVTGSLSQSDLVFCAFTDVAGSLSQSDLVFCAFTDVACGWKWPIFCAGSYPLWRLIFSIRLMF